MKIRNIMELIGIKGKPKFYGYKVDIHKLEDFDIKYAQWQHPSESKKYIKQNEVNDYKKILANGDFCIDIGAHTGDSTLPMAVAVGKKGCILALEPNPYVYHVLEKNVRSNSDNINIKTIMAAASDYEGFVEFEYSDSGFCNGGNHKNISVLKHGHTFKLNVFCIDIEKELRNDYKSYLKKLKFIKIDAEGYDLYIIKAMINIIKEYKPIIKAEIYKKTNKEYRLNILNLFKEINYNIFKLEVEPIGKGEVITIDNIEKWKHYDIICEPN